MAVAVVDELEPVEVEEEHRAVGSRPSGPCQQVLESVEDESAVRQAGEQVVHGCMLQLLLGALALGDVVTRDDDAVDCRVTKQVLDASLDVMNLSTDRDAEVHSVRSAVVRLVLVTAEKTSKRLAVM